MSSCFRILPQLALALGKNGDVEYAEQLSKVGLETALDVYGEEDPKYKELSEVFEWITNMSDTGENPIGDAMSGFGV